VGLIFNSLQNIREDSEVNE